MTRKDYELIAAVLADGAVPNADYWAGRMDMSNGDMDAEVTRRDIARRLAVALSHAHRGRAPFHAGRFLEACAVLPMPVADNPTRIDDPVQYLLPIDQCLPSLAYASPSLKGPGIGKSAMVGQYAAALSDALGEPVEVVKLEIPEGYDNDVDPLVWDY